MKNLRERLLSAAVCPERELFELYMTGEEGMSRKAAELSREYYGRNVMKARKGPAWTKRLMDAFVNPFTVVLLVLAVISAFTDILLANPGERSYAAVVMITAMVAISGILRFVQESKSQNAAAKLAGMIRTTASVRRLEDGRQEIPMDDIVVGDIVCLSAGDMVPADVRILTAKDLFVSQSSLTGESEPVEKQGICTDRDAALTEMANLAFMGSNVVSGSAEALVIGIGDDTVLGAMARELTEKPPKTQFEKGVNSVSWLLIRFMAVMAPVVFVMNGLTKGDWLQAALFSVSVAVGLTPEMLPMIVTAALAKGAVAMSRKKVIIKNLNAIQNLGSMDILCTDKTGTLTQDKVVLEYHLNIDGEEDRRVLRHAFLNSYFQTGLKNLIDVAVIEKQQEIGAQELTERYQKIDEIPFDFNRRRMSVVVRDDAGKTQMVTKGAVEEMLACCSFAELNGMPVALTVEVKERVLKKSDELNSSGMRVIAVAQKTNPSPVGEFSAKDETGMVLIGFLAFLDPPKETTAAAIRALKEYGVSVKILTGDNEKVTVAVCRQVGLRGDRILLGTDIDTMTDEELKVQAEDIQVFAKLSPTQKARIVRLLRENGHTVGYMGDGINDAAAMKAADAGISVDTAVDIAKESAGVVLLEKDLMVLEEGIIEGRKTYANMVKYIKMTASSNFGNMFSVLAASVFLPFLPMAALHLILLNLIYDVSCTVIPWDNVDPEYLKKPRSWDASSIGRFMVRIGPVSSLFDIVTYLLLYFVICPMATGGLRFTQLTDPQDQLFYIALFQTGWFIESMWSQTLVIHMIRTPKLPFVQSRASVSVTILTLAGIAAVTLIPFTGIGSLIGLASLPHVYFGWLAGIVAVYMVLVTAVKKSYIHRYREWL